MKNPKARKRKCAAAVACTVLLARIRKILRENIKAGKEWQEKPSRRGQGEARGMVRICEELLTELRVMGRRYHANDRGQR